MRSCRKALGRCLARGLAFALCATMLGFAVAPARAGLVSPHAQRTEPLPGPGQPYRVWVGGHAYGPSIHPVASLLANAERADPSEIAALFLLGDTLRYPTPPFVRALERALSLFRVPVFVVPGNHEQREPGAWAARFGPPSFALRIGSDLFIAVDLRLGPDAVPRNEVAWLERQFQRAREDPAIRAVVVLSHHLAWALDEPALAPVVAQLNYLPDYRRGFFARHVDPLLERLSAERPVVWLSGDVGGFPPLYWKHPRRDLRFVATGLDGRERDALVEVSSDGAGRLALRLVPLGGHRFERLERYGPESWRAHFVARDLPVRVADDRDPLLPTVRSFVGNRRFVAGVAFGAGVALAFVAAAAWLRHRARRADRGA